MEMMNVQGFEGNEPAGGLQVVFIIAINTFIRMMFDSTIHTIWAPAVTSKSPPSNCLPSRTYQHECGSGLGDETWRISRRRVHTSSSPKNCVEGPMVN